MFLSGLRKIKTTLNGDEQKSWRPQHVYHYIQWKNLEPDFVIDVSGFVAIKMEAVQAYSSQFYDPKVKSQFLLFQVRIFRQYKI